MASRLSVVEVLALAFGREFPVRWRGRTLVATCGPVSRAVPLLVRYRGPRRLAIRARDRLRRAGFRQVEVRRLPKVKAEGGVAAR